MEFRWDEAKSETNLREHGLRLEDARPAFLDPNCVVWFDAAHSSTRELRWWLLGQVDGRVLTVRYTHRKDGVIRLIGAGWWRKGKDIYDQANV